jgi:hypothetical protein
MESLVVPSDDVDAVVKRKFPCPDRKSNPCLPVRSLDVVVDLKCGVFWVAGVSNRPRLWY